MRKVKTFKQNSLEGMETNINTYLGELSYKNTIHYFNILPLGKTVDAVEQFVAYVMTE